MRYLSTLLLLIPLQALAQSTNEMVKQGNDSVLEINNIHQNVNEILVEAQKTSKEDPVLLQCVSTKQASITALKEISETALKNMEVANNDDKVAYELRKISLSLSKVRQFGNEAKSCTSTAVGEAEEGNTQVSVDETRVNNTFTTATVGFSESYSFDSSSGSAESINPAPETSPY
jgi:hypothetical protein